MELMPSHVARSHRCHILRLLLRIRFKEQEHRAARVGGDGKPTDVGDVLGAAGDRAASRYDACGIAVDVIDRET